MNGPGGPYKAGKSAISENITGNQNLHELPPLGGWLGLVLSRDYGPVKYHGPDSSVGGLPGHEFIIEVALVDFMNLPIG